EPEEVRRWGDLGLTGSWSGRDLQLYGRNSGSGTYGYFKEVALCDGDFRNSVNEQPGSASVVQSVATSLNAIGYSGIGYVTSGVNAVAVAVEEGADYVAAGTENALAGNYPLARLVDSYVNEHPNKACDATTAEVVKFM